MPILSNLIVRIGASTDDYDKKVNSALGKAQRFAQSVTAAGEAMAIGFSAPILAAGGAAIKAASDMQSLEMGLKAVMKTTDATTAEMAKLREVAKLPGLGLEEAVRGSVRLQILGNSASESRRIMAELGNALAAVGGGREDFSEVIRQLSQLGAVGKVTKENLDPIVERIPQIAAIIKEKFGAAALGDPAKTFERMGISSQQFIRIIVDELAKGERAGNTYKNSWENIQMAAKDAAAEFGKTLLPMAQRVLDDFLTPGIQKAKEFAGAFNALPASTQNFAVALSAAAAAAPILIVALGTLFEKGAIVLATLNKLLPVLKGFAGGITLAGTAATAAAAAVGGFMHILNTHRQNTVDTSAEAIKRLNERVGTGAPAAFGAARDAVMGYMQVLKPSNEETVKTGEVAAVAAEKIASKAKAHIELKVATLDGAIAQKMAREYMDDYNKAIDRAAELGIKYGGITREQIALNIQVADTLFRYFRILENPPDVKIPGIGGGMKDVPRPDMPTFPGDFGEFKRTAENIGDLGMQTREQHEAMKRSAKDAAREASKAYRQVSTVMTDLSRGIADVIFKGGKLGDMFKNVAMQAAQSITRLLIEGALKKLQDKLFDVGGIMGKVFGGSGGGGKSPFVPGVPGIPGGGGGASAAAGTAMSGVMGAVTMVSGIASAVSGIIGNFQMAGMNKTLDLIEKEVRYSQIHLLNILEKANDFWPWLKAIHERLYEIRAVGVKLEEGGSLAFAGGPQVVININGSNPQQTLADITRLLKQYGVLPR